MAGVLLYFLMPPLGMNPFVCPLAVSFHQREYIQVLCAPLNSVLSFFHYFFCSQRGCN